ncbi:ANTAR domain-containing protein [Saccharothrix hoggarensis]|uniref:ANTAR domain-containing protein n=1 Tax=Saccharothrix hoggarensis TaxID=913853 RepID=A0ABW3QR59_9PSEU
MGERERASGDAGDSLSERLVRRLDDVTDALGSLSQLLEQEENLEVILDRVCRQVVQAIPGADRASVTLLRDGGPHTAATTDERAGEVDEAQYRAGSGPCLEAATTGKVVRVAVAEAHERWPVFAAAAARLGVSSYLSAPLFIDAEYRGSLNLYGEQDHGFRELDAALLELYTTAAETALRNARRYLKTRQHVVHLREALNSRAVIDQAKGIIMGAHRIPADEAFTLLVERSQRDNVKLRDVAERFVADVIGTDH